MQYLGHTQDPYMPFKSLLERGILRPRPSLLLQKKQFFRNNRRSGRDQS
jgi:hypothetical protein